jgi:rare lipoprotein A
VPPPNSQPGTGVALKSTPQLPAMPAAGSGRGGYYQDDGPGDHPPDDLQNVPDVIPKVEPYSTSGNKPYVVFGKTYTPMLDERPYKQRGTGSWYGKKFHGQKTSSGELYDMYKLTAAHPTLPIPSYARVTNLSNGVQIIVRINDRGPFHSGRIIDLSYTAALKLGYLGKGSSELEVERLLPDDIARINATRQEVLASASAPAPVPPTPNTGDAAPETHVEALAIPAMFTQAAELTPLPPVSPPLPPLSPLPPATDGNGASSVPASGFYLQFGAFGAAANAEAARLRLMQNWDSALPALQVSYIGALYRVHSGPFANRAEAALAAKKMLAITNIDALIVQR